MLAGYSDWDEYESLASSVEVFRKELVEGCFLFEDVLEGRESEDDNEGRDRSSFSWYSASMSQSERDSREESVAVLSGSGVRKHPGGVVFSLSESVIKLDWCDLYSARRNLTSLGDQLHFLSAFSKFARWKDK